MRGNHFREIAFDVVPGSIPAHAGEPRYMRFPFCVPKVYPRACGGTLVGVLRGGGVGGLSPRMRGNRGRWRGRGLSGGSIPAHAGEPPTPFRSATKTRVYPRACGGTGPQLAKPVAIEGLSPRMRGNLVESVAAARDVGSIPAHAGEPTTTTGMRTNVRVYPRACGGTHDLARDLLTFQGLSPRMRGNPEKGLERARAIGSIPAHAGEPVQAFPGYREPGVYPRACGGTAAEAVDAARTQGLSPRMRGNPWLTDVPADYGGSIPAHAGEPAAVVAEVAAAGVYPRACGGTLNSVTKYE